MKIKQYERTLLRIVEALPPERVAQIVDFARFLQSQTLADKDELIEDETEEEILADEAKWDALFAKPEAQRLMVEMAREAMAEEEAGLTSDWETLINAA